MPQVEIISQSDLPGGWMFETQTIDGDGRLHALSLRLSWADYNLWSRVGSDPPHAVALAVMSFLLSRRAISDLPIRLDASRARRWYSDADEIIPTHIPAEH